jgi:nucleoside-diphosphate-sugar epimerase
VRVSVLGCGWLGLPLAQELVRRGHEVRGSVTRADRLAALAAAGVKGYRLELTPTLEEDAEGFFEGDALVVTLPPGRREAGVEARYPAQLAAVLAATPAGTQLVFTGSTSVYPELNRTVSEADAGGDVSASGRAILAAEALLRARGATILRLAGLYGYDRQPGRRLAGREVSGGDARVNLVHRDDVVRVLVQVLEARVADVILNVCADRHPTRREVYSQQAARLGLEPPRFVEPHAQDYKCVSSEALKAALGFSFRYPDPLEGAP